MVHDFFATCCGPTAVIKDIKTDLVVTENNWDKLLDCKEDFRTLPSALPAILEVAEGEVDLEDAEGEVEPDAVEISEISESLKLSHPLPFIPPTATPLATTMNLTTGPGAEEALPTLLARRRDTPGNGATAEIDKQLAAKGEQKAIADVGREPEARGEQKPNFTGEWVLSKIEGNMDAILKDIGYPWLARKFVYAVNYGIGKVKLFVKHSNEGEQLELRVSLQGEYGSCWKMISDGQEREISVGAKEGERVLGTSFWHESLLVTEAKLRTQGRSLPTTRRYLKFATPSSQPSLIVEQITVDGTASAISTYTQVEA
eukprot:TRINITY_DN50052_c0_g1_i1.p1 TRINITY_DN50052_c0_g1~~TRINITY_DN50052_c0_g1_i1.p1  ORF type:complete len:315 (-),score=83.56 TRINITY_DN50052_c0_g1_i1:109-1053(-)